jgi:cellulose 1,4-beta-cellobiosidase
MQFQQDPSNLQVVPHSSGKHIMIFQSIFAVLLVAVKAQQVGYLQKEVHPQLSWKKCKAPGACSSVSGKVVLDAEWRWLRKVDSYHACYLGQSWLEDSCSSVEDCTTNCAVEGAESYERLYGVKTKNDSISQKFVTYHEFSSSINNRVFLLESDTRYQTFTLMNNEIAFDVDLSTVECGIASSLYFVEMDPDGGMSKFPTNKAGAAYGTGYCDASCPRSNKFIAGKVMKCRALV